MSKPMTNDAPRPYEAKVDTQESDNNTNTAEVITEEDRYYSIAERFNELCVKHFGRRFNGELLYQIIYEEMNKSEETIHKNAIAKVAGMTHAERKILGVKNLVV